MPNHSNSQISTIQITKDGLERMIADIKHMESVLLKEGDEVIVSHDGIGLNGRTGPIRFKFANKISPITQVRDVVIVAIVVAICVALVVFAMISTKKKAVVVSGSTSVEQIIK